MSSECRVINIARVDCNFPVSCEWNSPQHTQRWDDLPIVLAGWSKDIEKGIKLSTVALFWRDLAACCFTMLRFHTTEDHAERARRMASTLESFSLLQLYCVIFNEKILPWQPSHTPPPSGSESRLLIGFNPSEPLNPGAGIVNLRVTVPGPCNEVAEIFTAQPTDFKHLYWRQLEEDIVRWLRLPNGLPVTSAASAARIKFIRWFDLDPECRPQSGKPPVDFSISDTLRKIDAARSRLASAERGNQPLEYALTKLEKYQHQLDFLQRLNNLEQGLWQQLQSPAHAPDDQSAELPVIELAPIVDRTRYLPFISQSIPAEWSDLDPVDFENPDLWAQVGQLKSKFKITTERTFWRTLARLKAMGLRILPARQDKRIRLFYRPEIDRLLAQSAPINSAAAQFGTSDQLNGNEHLREQILDLQKQQRTLLSAVNRITAQLDSLNSICENQSVDPNHRKK